MKPTAFEYFRPGTVDEAIDLLQRLDPDAKILAGGQSLVPLMNFRLAQPRYLIDTNSIRDLAYIRETSTQHRPGTVTHHHGEEDHMAYLERPFLEAQAAIHRRMHHLGIPH